MRKYILLLTILLMMCCSQRIEKVDSSHLNAPGKKLDIGLNEVNKSKLNYDPKTSQWTLDGKLYSGYATVYFSDNTLSEKIGFLDGKKQNESSQWYQDGHYKQRAFYHKGKLHGEKKTWSADSTHTLISHLNYHSGKAHGEQKKWYVTGELFKVLNLEMGKEEGMQRAYRKNGDLFANYEAKNGRIFGLKKAALCFGLEDENIQDESE